MPVLMSEQLCRAIYAFLARAPSRLLIVPLEDVLGELETPNFPGLPVQAYPSWRLKMGRNIEDVKRDVLIHQFSQIIIRNRLAHAPFS